MIGEAMERLAQVRGGGGDDSVPDEQLDAIKEALRDVATHASEWAETRAERLKTRFNRS